jgi:uncharacterized protein (DUF1800 family)
MMKRFALALASAAISIVVLRAGGPFDAKLSSERQIVQVLNRLTFGPRPGDVEEVRRIGLDKWIDLQLHPERIPENQDLDARLEPFETLRMDSVQVVKQYAQAPQMMMMMNPEPNAMNLLSQEERRKVMNGTAEERRAALSAMDEDKRKQVLLTMPPTNLASIPEFQQEADEARKQQQTKRQEEMRRRNPPLDDLLTFDQIATVMRGDPDQLKELFAGLEPEKRGQVAGAMRPQALSDFPDLRREGMKLRQPLQVVSGDLKAGKLLRAIYSDRQLEEVLVDFWFNHFNVYEGKNIQLVNSSLYRGLLVSYERDAIRPHVLGHFKDLLLATARHPAMLYYLDNWQSMSTDTQDRLQVGPFSRGLNQVFLGPAAARQLHGLNENYGRELMELHTLGVGGGYTQQDVIDVARCFTGWTVRRSDDPEFAFIGFMHDDSEKVVLGHKIPAGGGENDGLQVIDILAHHPSTARFISRQLAQRFVADDPPESLVNRMAQTFQKTDGDLRAVLAVMFSSTEFLSEGAWQAKIKSPFEMVVSALRATGADARDNYALVQKISDLGEPLYGKVEPNGYPLIGDGWLGTADLLGRMSFATTLAAGTIPGVKVNASQWEGKDVPAIARDLLGRDTAPETLEAISTGLQGKESNPRAVAGLIIGSPEFNRR